MSSEFSDGLQPFLIEKSKKLVGHRRKNPKTLGFGLLGKSVVDLRNFPVRIGSHVFTWVKVIADENIIGIELAAKNEPKQPITILTGSIYWTA
jgi:hypothetical protein